MKLINYTLSLYFGNEKLLDKNISIKEKDKIIIEQIHPRIAPAAVESRFIVFVDGNLDVSTLSFEWDFGDGSLKETSRVPFTEHAFPNIGNYEVTVTAFEGVKKIDSRKFSVSTVSPEEAVGEILSEYKSRIERIKTQKNSLTSSQQDALTSVFNLPQIDTKIKDTESQYLALSQNENTEGTLFVGMANDLLRERIPRDIKPSSTSDVKFLYEFNDLNS